jgi:hypothetical protein
MSCNTTEINDHNIIYTNRVILIKSSEITVDYEIKDDLSISWTYNLSQRIEFINTKNIFIKFEMITKENDTFGMISAATFNHFGSGIRPQDIIRPIVIANPKEPKYLHGTITKYNYAWTEKEEWHFYIDISNINIVIEDEEIKPGTFTRFVGQWVPEYITLENGQWFTGNAYYLITSYRNQDHRVFCAIFKVDNDTEIINNENGKLNLNSGGLFLEEMHLRRIIISNNYEGTTLIVTPESKNIFKVEVGSIRIY